MCKATFVHHWKQSIKTQNCHCTAMTCVFQCLCNTFTYHWKHKQTQRQTTASCDLYLPQWLYQTDNSTVTSYRDRQTALWPVTETDKPLWPVTETDKQHCDQLQGQTNSAVTSVQRQTTALWPVTETNSTVTSYRNRQQRCDQLQRQTTELWPVYSDRQQCCDQHAAISNMYFLHWLHMYNTLM